MGPETHVEAPRLAIAMRIPRLRPPSRTWARCLNSRLDVHSSLLDNPATEASTRTSLAHIMSKAQNLAKAPKLLDRALIGLLILVVLVLLGMEVVTAGGPPVS